MNNVTINFLFMGEKIKPTPPQTDKEELPSRSAVTIFLEDILIRTIIEQEKAQPNVFELLHKFREDNPEIGDALSLEDIYDEVSSRIYDNYASGDFNPLVVKEAYELVEEAIDIKEFLSQARA